MPRNNASCSELTEVMSRVVDAAAPFNLRAAKPRKLKCSIYKMDSLFFFFFFNKLSLFPSWCREVKLDVELKKSNKQKNLNKFVF